MIVPKMLKYIAICLGQSANTVLISAYFAKPKPFVS